MDCSYCGNELLPKADCKCVIILYQLNEIYYYVKGKTLSVFQNNLLFFCFFFCLWIWSLQNVLFVCSVWTLTWGDKAKKHCNVLLWSVLLKLNHCLIICCGNIFFFYFRWANFNPDFEVLFMARHQFSTNCFDNLIHIMWFFSKIHFFLSLIVLSLFKCTSAFASGSAIITIWRPFCHFIRITIS